MANKLASVATTTEKSVRSSSSGSYTSLPDIMGVIPFGSGSRPESKNLLMNSLPVMFITPCKPQFMEGLTLFRLNPEWEI